MQKKLLVISGFDPSANAGMLKDITVARNCGLTACGVVTALTVQNKTSFKKYQTVHPTLFLNQLDSLLPLRQYGAIKIGMLGDDQIVNCLAEFLRKQKKLPPVVLDPVLESTTGYPLMNPKGKKLILEKLIPLVSLWTPNWPEALAFSTTKKRNVLETARALEQKSGTPILLKGGHISGKYAEDILVTKNEVTYFLSPRMKMKGLRGTGCVLSTLIACGLANGLSVIEAISQSKNHMAQTVFARS